MLVSRRNPPKPQRKPPTKRPVRTNSKRRSVAVVPRPKFTRNDVSKVCSITDPFCAHANGAKLFSSSTGRTLPHQFHGRISLSTDSNGMSSMLVLPSYNILYGLGTVTSPNAAYTTISGAGPTLAATSYRIVSWGLKLRKISAPLYAAGMVRIRTFGNKNGTDFASIPLSAYNCDTFEDVPLSTASEICVIGRRLDYTYSKFVTLAASNPTNNVTDWVAPGWGAVQIVVDGGPVTTAVLDVELFFNYEITLADSDALMQLSTPPVADHPVATAAANAVYTSSKSIFINGVQQASKFIERTAITALATYFGGPAMGRGAALLVD